MIIDKYSKHSVISIFPKKTCDGQVIIFHLVGLLKKASKDAISAKNDAINLKF